MVTTPDQAAYILRVLYEIWGSQHGLRVVEFEAAERKESAPAGAPPPTRARDDKTRKSRRRHDTTPTAEREEKKYER